MAEFRSGWASPRRMRDTDDSAIPVRREISAPRVSPLRAAASRSLGTSRRNTYSLLSWEGSSLAAKGSLLTRETLAGFSLPGKGRCMVGRGEFLVKVHSDGGVTCIYAGERPGRDSCGSGILWNLPN